MRLRLTHRLARFCRTGIICARPARIRSQSVPLSSFALASAHHLHRAADAREGAFSVLRHLAKENTMQLENLQDLFVDQLRDLYNAENQLVKALPKMAKKATDEQLKSAFEDHLDQ